MSNDAIRGKKPLSSYVTDVPASEPQSARPDSLSIATVNDDFGTKKSNLPRVKRHTDILLAQETKYENVHQVLGSNFGVHQNLESEATKGSTVAWKKNKVDVKDGGQLKMSDAGHGTMARYLTFNDVRMKGGIVRVASVHRPPGDSKANWPQFDKNLRKFLQNSPYPTVVAMDANAGPAAMKQFAKSAGAKWHVPAGPTRHGETIDGFFSTPGVTVENLKRLPAGSSDHTPVTADIHLTRKLHQQAVLGQKI